VESLIKPNDLAERLGVSRTWLYAAARDGRIPSIRVGGEHGPLRFIPEDIDRWIDRARDEWQPGRPTATASQSAPPPRRLPRATSRHRARGTSGQQKLI